LKEEIEDYEKDSNLKADYSWFFFDLFLVIVENLLAFRIVLKFLGAPSLNPFFSSFYLLTDFFAGFGLRALSALNASAENSVFEGSTVLVFFLIYTLHQLILRRQSLKKGGDLG